MDVYQRAIRKQLDHIYQWHVGIVPIEAINLLVEAPQVAFKDVILSDAEASSAAKTKFLANWMTERKLV